MSIGAGGLVSSATQDLIANIVKLVDKSEPKERKMDTASSDTSNVVNNGQTKVNREDLIKAVDNVNKAFEPFSQGIQFKVDEETQQLVVKVVRQDTGEVLKQIPSQDLLDMEASIRELVGLFVDKKA